MKYINYYEKYTSIQQIQIAIYRCIDKIIISPLVYVPLVDTESPITLNDNINDIINSLCDESEYDGIR